MRDNDGICAGERPIEALARGCGYEVVVGEGMGHACFLVVGARVLIVVPEWARGVEQREALVALQLVLFALSAVGGDRFGTELVVMRGEACGALAA